MTIRSVEEPTRSHAHEVDLNIASTCVVSCTSALYEENKTLCQQCTVLSSARNEVNDDEQKWRVEQVLLYHTSASTLSQVLLRHHQSEYQSCEARTPTPGFPIITVKE